MQSREDVALSKKLSYLLRHGAVKEDIHIRPDGYVALRDICRTKGFRGVSESNIRRVVELCPKQRFSMVDFGGQSFIRANQGHTISAVVDEELLGRIEAPEQAGLCVHGTVPRGSALLGRFTRAFSSVILLKINIGYLFYFIYSLQELTTLLGN
jgi:RNA:NAD 2'-phosphotransferase (TPT1/KptA family)